MSWVRWITQKSPHSKALGRMIGVLIIVGAIVVSIIAVWGSGRSTPRQTTPRCGPNFIGVAPQVNGHIVELHVRDNQLVQAGDLLFVIDPARTKSRSNGPGQRSSSPSESRGLWNALSSAKAGVGKAGAQVGAVSADITRAEAPARGGARGAHPCGGEFTHCR